MHRIVLDTSALISLAHGSILDLVLAEFQAITSDIVVEELKKTAQYEDPDGKAAEQVLERKERLEIREVGKGELEKLLSSRIDAGEASCVVLAKGKGIKALISDDFDAMHQLEYYSKEYRFELGLCAVLVKALVLRGKLEKKQGEEIFEKIAAKRGWIGRQIYEYGKGLL